MRRILRPTFLVILAIFILLAGCSSGSGQPSPRPAFTLPPEDEGSALLLYVLSSEQESLGFKASSDIGIPIAIMVDPKNTKERTPIEGTTLADYFMQMGALDGGVMCYTEFAFLVEYTVKGYYNPVPKCDFDITVTVKVLDDEVVRSGNCSVPVENFIAEGIKEFIIPPPPGLKENNGFHPIPGSLPVVAIREDEHTKITIELKNVIVPSSSGCNFGD